jgi:hypothetical protein
MLRKLLIALVVLALVIAGVVFYFWRQATALPDWYEEERASPTAQPEEHASASPRGELRWTPVAKDDADASKDAVEVRGFHNKTPLVRGKARKAIKASRAVRTKDKLEAGVVLDTSKLPRDMSKQDNDVLERAIANFPGLTKRDVYVGIEDSPVTKNGILQLSPNARLRIGNLTYSLPDAARKLGIDEKKLRADLNRRLRKMNITDPKATP